MKKYRLMQITHDLDLGGLQQVIVNICRHIDRERFDISVLCLRNLGMYLPDVESLGIKVFSLPQKQNKTDYFSFLKVARILREEKIDIIHTHNTQPLFDGTIAALMSGVKTIIHTDHARIFPDKKRYMFAEWLMSHFVYKIAGVSDDTSKNLIEYEKISPQKIVTIPNGISENNITIDKGSKKKEIGIKKGGPIIGLAARLTRQKGIHILLKAMPEIIKEFPDITLVIAGEGDYEIELKKKSEDLGIREHILFLGARLDITELFKIFDIYAICSLWEGLPMVLLEAMASGCPIVSTNVGGIPMVINHGVNGSLIEPQNSSLFASEIIKLLKDNGLRERYSKNGLDTFRKGFTAKIMTEKYQKLYLRES